MLTAAFAVVLTCLPAPLEEHVVSSADGGVTLEVTSTGLAVRDNGVERWRLPTPPAEFEQHVLSDDGSWVAIIRSPTRDVKSAVVTVIDAKGRPRDAKPFAALTADERNSLPYSSCGSIWLAAARANGGTLELDIYQGAFPLPHAEADSVRHREGRCEDRPRDARDSATQEEAPAELISFRLWLWILRCEEAPSEQALED